MALASESVAIRHRGAYDFETHYCSLCSLQDTVPLLEVKVSNSVIFLVHR